MDELELTRRALGVPPEDPQARALARARLRAAFKDQPLPGPSGRRRRGIASVAIAVAVAVLAVVLVVSSHRDDATAAALRGLRQELVLDPVSGLIPGETLVVQTESFHLETLTDLPSGKKYGVEVLSSDTFQLESDGSGVVKRVIASVELASEADEKAWLAAGSPPLLHAGQVLTESIERGGSLWYDVSSVSTDPDTLLRRLRSGEIAPITGSDDQVFSLVSLLLGRAPLDQGQRLALLDVITHLNPTSMVDGVSDPLSRSGMGFEVRTQTGTTRTIFDPATGRVLATETFDERSAPTAWIAFTSSEVVAAEPSAS
jgi:hypothetical protein